MTIEEYKAAHYEMWNWLVEHPGKTKRDWPGWEKVRFCENVFNGRCIDYNCFMCDWYESDCAECPLFHKFNRRCFSTWGVFEYWSRATKRGKKSKARRLAIMIRDAWR